MKKDSSLFGGQFFFITLICRFTVIQPIYLQLIEITDWVIMARLVSIIFSLIIALIPSLMITAFADLNETH